MSKGENASTKDCEERFFYIVGQLSSNLFDLWMLFFYFVKTVSRFSFFDFIALLWSYSLQNSFTANIAGSIFPLNVSFFSGDDLTNSHFVKAISSECLIDSHRARELNSPTGCKCCTKN